MELVRNHLLYTIFGCLEELLRKTIPENATQPPSVEIASDDFPRDGVLQCAMDLLYVLDHVAVAEMVLSEARLRQELCTGWLPVLRLMQAMNRHQRRTEGHEEYVS